MATRQISLPAALTSFDEGVRDAVGTALVGGEAVAVAADDGADTITVHGIPVDVAILTVGTLTLANMGAAETELTAGGAISRPLLDLTRATQARLVTQTTVAGSAGSVIRLKYSTDNTTFLTMGTTEVDAPLDVAVGGTDSGWIDLVAGAKADVRVAVFSAGGDGVADPSLRRISAQFR